MTLLRAHKKSIFLLVIGLSLVCLLSVGTPVAAQEPDTEFVSLSGVPGIEPSGGEGLGVMFNTVYIIVIIIGSIFAVVKIAVAGTRYMMSDVITSKESARQDINGAILGLVIILSTYIVLSTIYPDLVSFDILQNASVGEALNLESASSESGTPSCPSC